MNISHYQIFDLFGEPVYCSDLDKTIAQYESRLDAYPYFESMDDPTERQLRTAEYRLMRQHYRHLLNQLYTIKGEPVRLRGEIRFSYLDNPQHVIHASVLDELPPTATANSGLIVRYTCPEHPQPIIRELWLDDIRIINLSYQTNQALPLDFIPQRPLRKKWGVGEAQIAMPLHFN